METSSTYYTSLAEAKMAKRRVMFLFTQELVKQPIVYNLGHQFRVVANFRRVDVSEDTGCVVLELEREETEG